MHPYFRVFFSAGHEAALFPTLRWGSMQGTLLGGTMPPPPPPATGNFFLIEVISEEFSTVQKGRGGGFSPPPTKPLAWGQPCTLFSQFALRVRWGFAQGRICTLHLLSPGSMPGRAFWVPFPRLASRPLVCPPVFLFVSRRPGSFLLGKGAGSFCPSKSKDLFRLGTGNADADLLWYFEARRIRY